MNPNQQNAAPGPAPRRDLTGIWDAGGPGIGPRGFPTSPLTSWGEQLGNTHKAGDGSRMVPTPEINDPLSTLGDPAGFPRLLLFELRPIQIVHTPNSVLMLYMFEKRWRIIWTDGRQLPKDPDPRWYGYSVGRWEDDTTFVVESVGMDERTWLDNSGNPHSDQMRVEERYHRVNQNMLELTVMVDDPKTYTKPWVPRNKLPLRLLPAGTDLMEMIPSASEAAAYRKAMAEPIK
ncbi:MAG: hypothetical protein DMG11_33495 [Acidobacteria bacterium]|nr:MAG: hypothetical protein DMG11_33495 [Acidobacteriota bacterium]